MNPYVASTVDWVRAVNRRPAVVDLVRRIRRVMPGDPTFGDPLSMAGPGSALALARAADRFLDDEPGATREFGLGALQIWQAVLERTGHGRGERDVTIVFTDLVGFSSWSLAVGDADTLVLLRKVSKAIEPAVAAGGGHVVKRLGDGIMAVFYRPESALESILEARDALSEVDVNGYTPTMRVGLHTGSPRCIGSDWLGVDVTIAARVMQAGGNGNLMMSLPTLDALPDGTLDRLGLVAKPYRRGFFAPKLSGVPEDLKIVRLVQPPER